MHQNKGLLGAIIGDIVGSARKLKNVKTEDFELLPMGSCFTENTVMTLAVAEWLMLDHNHTENGLVRCMQKLGRRHPNAGYDSTFKEWLSSNTPIPCRNYINGSAMIVSPVGLYAVSKEEAMELARIAASVMRCHPQNIIEAQNVAADVYTKKTECSDIIAGCNSALSDCDLPKELEEQCRKLLPPDLLEINDRFMSFVNHPLYQSYGITINDWTFFAGEYPCDLNTVSNKEKIKRMTCFGIKHFIDLTKIDELQPYSHLLPEDTTYCRFPIKNCGIPDSVKSVHELIHYIDELKQKDGYIYIHCRGGVGRTGTIVACIIAKTMKDPTLRKVLSALSDYFSEMPKSSYINTPETNEQIAFIQDFINSLSENKNDSLPNIIDVN